MIVAESQITESVEPLYLEPKKSGSTAIRQATSNRMDARTGSISTLAFAGHADQQCDILVADAFQGYLLIRGARRPILEVIALDRLPRCRSAIALNQDSVSDAIRCLEELDSRYTNLRTVGIITAGLASLRVTKSTF
jgi:hypothetical protein